MCGVFVDDWVSGGWFLFSGGFMLEWWKWDLITLAQFQGSEMSPGLFQDFMDGYIKPVDPPLLVVEDSLMVMSASSQSRRSQIKLYR